ncbi:MAG: hypothetical protein IJK64_11055 [Clostridia bacterium]|nr:hypothetical protein [Clostridia bacterium]
MRSIIVSDFTLRQCAEDAAHRLLFREKVAVAACIDAFGADRLELPPVRNAKEDAVINKTIASAVKNAAVCIPTGDTAESLAAAWNSIQTAVRPCLQVVLPVSTVQMEYRYHLKDEKMLAKIAAQVTAAKALCDNVEFIAQDATRAEDAFLIAALRQAQESGAAAATLCDDAGVYMPEEFAAKIRAVKAAVDLPLYVQVSNAIAMAAADALAALAAGADGVKTAITGKQVLTTDQFAEVLKVKGESLGICAGLKQTEIHTDIDALLKKLERNDFIHTEAQSADVFLDAESTLAQVSDAAAALGYALSGEDLGKVYDAVQRVSKKKSVGARELEAVIATSAMQVPSTYHVESYMSTCTNGSNAMAQITLVCGEEKLTGVAAGDGPIDSAFLAIEQIVGHNYELDAFEIQAVTEGKEALGSALVRLRSNGRLYSGNGLSTDIVGASIRAYVNALNKIVYEEKQS